MHNIIELAKDLLYSNNEIDIYKELIDLYQKNGHYFGTAACCEKLWHISQNHELLIQLGDIAKNNLNDNVMAFISYSLYLKNTKQQFFEDYLSVIKKNLISENFCLEQSAFLKAFENISNEVNDTSELKIMADKHCAIVQMMAFACLQKEYETVLELKPYLTTMKERIESYVNTSDKVNMKDLDDIKNENAYVSSVLSKTKHHNDINYLAITLNPENQTAYINIIEDFIVYNNYEQALDFYNTNYCNAFSEANKNISIVDLCWLVSDKYSSSGDYYNALVFQKKAIELELGEQSE